LHISQTSQRLYDTQLTLFVPYPGSYTVLPFRFNPSDFSNIGKDERCLSLSNTAGSRKKSKKLTSKSKNQYIESIEKMNADLNEYGIHDAKLSFNNDMLSKIEPILHSSITSTLTQLGISYQGLKQWDTAIDYFKANLEFQERCIEIKIIENNRTRLKKLDFKTMSRNSWCYLLGPYITSLGFSYLCAGKYTDAYRTFIDLQLCLGTPADSYGWIETHSLLAITSLLMDQGGISLHHARNSLYYSTHVLKNNSFLSYVLRHDEAKTKALKPHIATAIDYNNIGVISCLIGRGMLKEDNPDDYMQKSLEIFSRHLGDNNPILSITSENARIISQKPFVPSWSL